MLLFDDAPVKLRTCGVPGIWLPSFCRDPAPVERGGRQDYFHLDSGCSQSSRPSVRFRYDTRVVANHQQHRHEFPAACRLSTIIWPTGASSRYPLFFQLFAQQARNPGRRLYKNENPHQGREIPVAGVMYTKICARGAKSWSHA